MTFSHIELFSFSCNSNIVFSLFMLRYRFSPRCIQMVDHACSSFDSPSPSMRVELTGLMVYLMVSTCQNCTRMSYIISFHLQSSCCQTSRSLAIYTCQGKFSYHENVSENRIFSDRECGSQEHVVVQSTTEGPSTRSSKSILIG